MKFTVYSNIIYIVVSYISYNRKLYIFSLLILLQGIFSTLAHIYNTELLNKIDIFLAIINFIYGYLQCIFIKGRVSKKVLANVINIISLYYLFNKKNYEFNHSVWHILNGLSALIVGLYGDNYKILFNLINK